MKILLILSALFAGASPYTYQKCELARVLQSKGLDGYHGYSLANWVCLVQYESSYDTHAINHNRRGRIVVSTDYGLFQINSYWWCDDGQTPNTHNGCHKRCADFLNNNIDDDIVCVKRVVRDRQGMNAWYGWKNNCKGQDLSHFLDGCNI
ncbi:lysozyme C-1/C-2-like [Cetorhinus maximus]